MLVREPEHGRLTGDHAQGWHGEAARVAGVVQPTGDSAMAETSIHGE